MFRAIFIALSCLLWIPCYAYWSVGQPNTITTSSITYYDVSTSCDPSTGTFLATWNDINSGNPYYSFYSPNTGWGTSNPISSSSHVAIKVINSFDPVDGIFLATWTDSQTNQPTYSVYSSVSGWSNPSPIPNLNTSVALGDTYNIFNSETGQFLVTWADNFPTYAFYTPGSGWSAINTISNDYPAANVFSSCDSTTGQFLVTWADISSGVPVYSFYDANTSDWTTGVISAAASVENDVLSACNFATGQFIATWADINANDYPYSSVYSPDTGLWGESKIIGLNTGVTDNVVPSFDSITGQFFACWSNYQFNGDTTYPAGELIYSFYTSETGWSALGTIPNTQSGGDGISCFDPVTGQFLLTWSDTTNYNFYPSFLFFTFIPFPPAQFFGRVEINRFLYQTDRIHRLMWYPPSDRTSIVSYQITRNGVVIATLPASGPHFYDDHHRSKKQQDIYTIVSISNTGQRSTSLSVALK